MLSQSIIKSQIESPEIDSIFCRTRRSQSMQTLIAPKFIGITIIPDHITHKVKQKEVEIIDEIDEFNQTKPLATSFFQRLLALEDRIIHHNYTLDILLELVKAIEYYDYMQDSIQCYFLEKMQSTLSKIESLKLLFPKQGEKTKKDKEEDFSPFVDGSVTQIDQDQVDDLNESIEKKAKKREKLKRMNFRQRQTSYAQTHSEKMLDYDLNFKRIERAKKMQIFMEATEKQTSTDFELVTGKCLHNYFLKDDIIQINIDKQNEEFEKRLQQILQKRPDNQIKRVTINPILQNEERNKIGNPIIGNFKFDTPKFSQIITPNNSQIHKFIFT